MRPIIGVSVNCTVDPEQTINKGLALADQKIQYVADDYIKAIERAGGTPVILPIVENSNSLMPILSTLDGVLFTGGSDIDPCYYNEEYSKKLGKVNAARDTHEIAFIKRILSETTLPIFGICRGCQLVNVVHGGSLHQDIASELSNVGNHAYAGLSQKHIATHKAKIKSNSQLGSILESDQIAVNSFHHQAIKVVGQGLEVIATAEDGTIEAIEKKGDRFVVAVQWHPEMMHEHDLNSIKLFKHFIEVCQNRTNCIMA